MSLAAGLNKILPAPRYTPDEPAPSRASGARILGGGDAEQAQLVLKKNAPPEYGKRSSWRPRSTDDFNDGGAFPEIPIAQYPLDMGRKGSSTTSKALSLQVDSDGKIKYDAIARQGHGSSRIVHASFKDLIPLRQRADVGEISLERPSEEDVAATTEKTKAALAALVSGAVAAQKPKTIKGTNRKEAQQDHQDRRAPAGPHGTAKVQAQEDPPRTAQPPPPVMHSPPRKLTAADQEAWTIPPPVSNWKNPKGYTVPLDKRLAADGRGLQDVTINDKFAQFAEALFTADRHAREEVKQRALMQQKLAEKEKMQKEENLRALAQKAREDATRGRSRTRSRSRSRSGSADSRSPASSRSRSSSRGSDTSSAAARTAMRAERRREAERELRMKRMGTERKIAMLAREQGRDIGEKIALGLAKPTQSQETMWDSRLFNQSSGFDVGFNEDQPYDKPLFAAQEAANSIYRPKVSMEDDEDAAEGEMERIKKSGRFEVLGRAAQGFKGSGDQEARDGPVQFEKDTADPFGVEAFVKAAGEKAGQKHGLQERERSPAGGASKRHRNANYD
ncbi:uncharacterized protein LAJ45_06253 [Morchella importuna]|uniref:uncharacterized protein n=1 Tax=Morchella importuna TaxID=1174673 RepID=UPI001E8E1ADC|nr:uncharacterized protein LAJ45_06253 [Morchella importuna]KAH8149622.1 hypothetical protein LAJ45_06253 [Morchella importuna]